MKKLFSLVMFTLLSVGSTWAEEVTVSLIGATERTDENTPMKPSIVSSSESIILGTCESSCEKSGYIYASNNSNVFLYNNNSFCVGRIFSEGNAQNWTDAGEVKQYGTFTIPNGYTYTVKSISHAIAARSAGFTANVLINNVSTTIHKIANITATRADNNEASISATSSSINNGLELSAGTYTINVTTSSSSNNSSKYFGFAEIVLTGELVSLSAPALSASKDAITLALTPFAQSKSETFTLKGSNLTDGTYNLTIPTVDGLSVSPTSFTVSEGAVEQEFTVTYISTTDVEEAIANISANVNDVTASVAVTYSSLATLPTQTTISETTTWDWSLIKEYTATANDGILLSKDTKPTDTEEFVMSNLPYYGFAITIPSTFNAQAIMFKGQYPIRKTFAQNCTISFVTTVPGVITVDFSDIGAGVGENDPYRYLNVNGINTEYYTKRNGTSDQKVSGEIFVPAGTVSITGMDADGETSRSINIYKITFKPVTSTTVKIDNGTGYRTFASKYPTDWTSVEGVTAYTAKVNNNEVTFSPVNGLVPAGKGLLLKADAAENTEAYTVPVAAQIPAEIDNDFIGVTTATEVEGAGIFVLLNGDEGLGFYKTTAEKFEVSANTAYLPATVSAARTFIALPGSETTGVNVVESVEATDGKMFDLQGRQVSKPTKGLYISNGKKYIVK